eukprot:TRINITY_DN64562_c0_g1_i1.p1 TRINITY_DN64562_c0_g1~~TRINITY_DN64562_c0_g1_i1.p1  ORF type:complete len:581 (-),score=160.95 TRINITY_DN64562_c0_g1_i1:115-1779(-)
MGQSNASQADGHRGSGGGGHDRASGAASGSSKAVKTVVDIEKVISKKGAIPISGRYITTRPLSADYTMDSKVLGSGMSGDVQLARGKADGRSYAVKGFKKKGLPPRKLKELQNEVEIYLALDHPHVARLEMVFEGAEEVNIVMEFMAGGELYNRLATNKRYSEQLAADTTYQMLLAVAYLHANGVAHRDLKLENFLYESKDSDHLKLIDFGFAKFWDRNKKMEQACGSVHYVAPEVLAHSYTDQADLWSLGVIVYMLLTGSPPFHGTDDEVLKKVKACRPHWSSRFKTLSETSQDFVRKLIVLDPAERLTAEQALAHPFILERGNGKEHLIDQEILSSLRNFQKSAHFKRAIYTMMAWSLTTEDRQQLREQFLAMDQQRRGTITHHDMKKVLTDNFHIASDEAEKLFESMDMDHDEQIAYSEFLAAIARDRIRLHEDVLRKTFSRFDKDQSGVISRQDLHDVLGASFEGESVKQLIAEADADHDGGVSYDEFLAYFQKVDQAAEDGSMAVPHEHVESMGKVIDRLMPDHVDPGALLHASSKKGSLVSKTRSGPR